MTSKLESTEKAEPNILLIEDGFFQKNNPLLEVIFFKYTDFIRKILYGKDWGVRQFGLSDFIFDIFFIFVLLFFSFELLVVIPLAYVNDNSTSNLTENLVSIIFPFISALIFTGYVYLAQSFRNFFIKFFLPGILKKPYLHIPFVDIVLQYFNGSSVELKPGVKFRFYLRSALILFILCSFFSLSCQKVLFYMGAYLQTGELKNLSFAVVSGFGSVFTAFWVYLFIFVTLSVIIILFIILGSTIVFPFPVNPLIEMGGTKEFGDIIISDIYLASFTLSVLPILLVSINFSEKVPDISAFMNNTISEDFDFIQANVTSSISQLKPSDFYQYIGIIFFFVLVLVLAIITLYAIHIRIRQKKIEELEKIEAILSDGSYQHLENPANYPRIQHTLLLYDKILALSEWPIKKIFIVEIMISFIPIIISYFIK